MDIVYKVAKVCPILIQFIPCSYPILLLILLDSFRDLGCFVSFPLYLSNSRNLLTCSHFCLNLTDKGIIGRKIWAKTRQGEGECCKGVKWWCRMHETTYHGCVITKKIVAKIERFVRLSMWNLASEILVDRMTTRAVSLRLCWLPWPWLGFKEYFCDLFWVMWRSLILSIFDSRICYLNLSLDYYLSFQ